MDDVALSIVIPAYNEEKRIVPTLEHVAAFVAKQSYSCEVIVVDDHSHDDTIAAVEKFIAGKSNFRLLKNDRNIGKGGSVKRGMLEAKGQFRLFSDADLSTPIQYAEHFMSILKGPGEFDGVIGSRRVRGAKISKRQPVLREAAGRVFSLLVRLLTLRGYIDTQCGFKMFTAKAARDIFTRQTINRFGFDVEILYIAQKCNFKIRETAVMWADSPATRVRLFRDSTMMFLDLVRIRLNDSRGRY